MNEMLEDLKKRREAVADFLRLLDQAIDHLDRLAQAGVVVPAGASTLVGAGGTAVAVPSASTAGAGSITESAVVLLRERQEPMTPAAIARSLQARGVKSSSQSLRSTLFTLMKERQKRVGDVVPVGDGTWVHVTCAERFVPA